MENETLKVVNEALPTEHCSRNESTHGERASRMKPTS